MQSISETIKVHDKFQFELKYTYPLKQEFQNAEYTVENYLFIPRNLDINPDTYGAKDYYRDMQKYIRLKTPIILLQNLLLEKDGLLKAVRSAMEELAHNPTSKTAAKSYTYHLKMLCSILKSALRDEEEYIENSSLKSNPEPLVERLLKEIEKITKEFRSFEAIIKVPHFDRKSYELWQFADEYISLLMDKYLARLYFSLKRFEINVDGMQLKIAKMLQSEAAYRMESGYPSVTDDNSENETVIYRMGALKKVMGSILFLKTKTKLEGWLLEQIITTFAAGLAMAFATAFIFLSRTKFEDFTISLFAILVIIYMFKDRIKDLAKRIVYGWAKKYIFDYKTIVMTNMGTKIGYCREMCSFLNTANIPPEIVHKRNTDYLTELDNELAGESILYSKKEIRIASSKCSKLLTDFKVDGVHDIIRINVRSFLNKMDNPEKSLYRADGKKCKIARGSRVYHINLIQKYGMKDQQPTYRMFRIVLNRNGLKRIEPVDI